MACCGDARTIPQEKTYEKLVPVTVPMLGIDWSFDKGFIEGINHGRVEQ